MTGRHSARSGAPDARPRRVILIVSGVFLALLLLGLGGAAYATLDYSNTYAGKMLPGTTVAGVDVGGMSFERALDEVKAAIRPQLTRRVTVAWDDHKKWRTTPKKLGARSDAHAAVAAALRTSRQASFMEKAKMRLLGEELDFSRRPEIVYPRQGVRGFIQGVASSVDRPMRDAELDYSSGWVEITEDRVGHKVLTSKGGRALHAALAKGGSRVNLPVEVVKPEVTADSFDQVLLVRIGENKLYLYEDGKITHSWPVATGQPEYMTPQGLFEVTEKRYLPTWINPAPDTWGASMPASIPPGPSNPLGLRAINWSAPAIRFHGTSATYSLGYNASHGCVRMDNADVIELYDMIEVGAPIASVVAGPLKPLYVASSTDPNPVASDQPDEPAAGAATGSDESSGGGGGAASEGDSADGGSGDGGSGGDSSGGGSGDEADGGGGGN